MSCAFALGGSRGAGRAYTGLLRDCNAVLVAFVGERMDECARRPLLQPAPLVVKQLSYGEGCGL